MVLSSPTVELKENVATPLALVVPDPGVIVFPLPLELRVTGTPSSGAPLASLTVTFMVLLPPVGMLLGSASIDDCDALGSGGAVGVQVTEKLTSEVVPPVTVTSSDAPSTVQFSATPESTTL
jgi:hypothetical protein